VRPERPTTPQRGAGEFTRLQGRRALWPAQPAARPAGRWSSGLRPLSSSEFPRAPSAVERRQHGCPDATPKRPKRRPNQEVQQLSFPNRRVPPVALYRSGEPPGIYIAHPSAHMGYSLTPTRVFSDARRPGDWQEPGSRAAGAEVVLVRSVDTPEDPKLGHGP
jgi:hypothetical protein